MSECGIKKILSFTRYTKSTFKGIQFSILIFSPDTSHQCLQYTTVLLQHQRENVMVGLMIDMEKKMVHHRLEVVTTCEGRKMWQQGSGRRSHHYAAVDADFRHRSQTETAQVNSSSAVIGGVHLYSTALPFPDSLPYALLPYF